MPVLDGTRLQGIRYHELTGSGGRSFGEAQQTNRQYLVDYANADEFAAILVGQSRRIGSGLQRYTSPVSDPDRPWLYCKSARVTGYGNGTFKQPNGTILYDQAKIDATFQPLERDDQTENPDSVVYIEENLEGVLEQFTLSTEDSEGESILEWKESGEPLDGDKTLSILDPQMSFSITIHNWFNAPVDAQDNPWLALMGKINRSTFRALRTSFKPKTLLFLNYTASRSFTSDGVTAWTVSQFYQAVNSERTWNHFFNEKEMEYQEVQTASGKQPFKTGDFRKLLP